MQRNGFVGCFANVVNQPCCVAKRDTTHLFSLGRLVAQLSSSSPMLNADVFLSGKQDAARKESEESEEAEEEAEAGWCGGEETG